MNERPGSPGEFEVLQEARRRKHESDPFEPAVGQEAEPRPELYPYIGEVTVERTASEPTPVTEA